MRIQLGRLAGLRGVKKEDIQRCVTDLQHGDVRQTIRWDADLQITSRKKHV